VAAAAQQVKQAQDASAEQHSFALRLQVAAAELKEAFDSMVVERTHTNNKLAAAQKEVRLRGCVCAAWGCPGGCGCFARGLVSLLYGPSMTG
jgi:hypothetical protein